jgi:transcriptional regulator with XRE-family HTH domain
MTRNAKRTPTTDLGWLLRAWRKAQSADGFHPMPMEKAAELSGLSLATWSEWENGVPDDMTLSKILQVSRLEGMSGRDLAAAVGLKIEPQPEEDRQALFDRLRRSYPTAARFLELYELVEDPEYRADLDEQVEFMLRKAKRKKRMNGTS